MENSKEKIPTLDPQKIHSRKFLSQSLFPIELWEWEEEGKVVPVAVKILTNPLMARREKEGLEELRKAGASVPKVYGIWESQKQYYLILEYCGFPFSGNKDQALRENLLSLYQSQSYKVWGESEANFIGTLIQPNSYYQTFSEYWLDSRINPMLSSIEKRGISTTGWKEELIQKIHSCIHRWELDAYLPRRIHGDLWGGNVLYSGSKSYLIDPSTSLGNPEQDLAMLSLFGSALSDSSRQEILKSIDQEKGWKERVPFWLVYPLLVHVAIFGTSYLGQLRSVMARL